MNRIAIAVALLAVISLFPGRAHAVYQCGNVVDNCDCGGNNPYPCCANGGN